MSKSDASEQSRINLSDNKDTIANKIKRAKTDSLPLPEKKSELSSRPELENLMNMYCSLSNNKLENVINDFQGKNFAFLKDKLTEILIEKICPIGEEIKKLLNDPTYLTQVLKEGSQKAHSIASSKIEKVYDKVGFLKLKN